MPAVGLVADGVCNMSDSGERVKETNTYNIWASR